MQISSNADQWTYLDKLYKSTACQLLGLHKSWKDKLALAFRDEITGAMADFFGLLTQLNQLLDPQSRCTAEG